MKLFKSTDDKLAEIGFVKIRETDLCAVYQRHNEKYGFTQMLDILHKKSGRHIVQSYDRDLFDTKGIGNTCVGLTAYEMKLAIRKMKKKRWIK